MYDTMDRNRVLPVFSETESDRTFLVNFFSETFKDLLTVVPVNRLNYDRLKFSPKAVIVTVTSAKHAKGLFPDSKLIYANRVITGYNLERVVQLPTNTTVLVVNHPKSIAIQTVKNLHSFGINHLNLIPYWPGSEMDISSYDIVVYAGFKNYCPENKGTYIDIGYRRVTMAVLIEIIKAYNLPTKFMDEQYNNYVELIINDIYRMNISMIKMKNLQKSFEQVCNLTNHAIIAIDHNSSITVFNPEAEQLFGIKSTEAVGTHYEECLKEYISLLEGINNKACGHEQLINVNKLNFLLSTDMNPNDSSTNIILHLEPVDKLQGTAEKIRSSLYENGFNSRYRFDDIKGNSEQIGKAISLARYYAKSDGTVLISGESGTGKELFAQSIHQASKRSRMPFVGVNFAAIPESLMESELFGYEEGAFTGAVKGGKKGLFRIAHQGTIFLDEIGDASIALQTRLLRVLEEQEVTPVGSSRSIPIDVRVICATNKDLEEMVEQGEFRKDLYYRIKVLILDIPPLRDRKTDIPLIINAILGLQSKVPDYLLTQLMQYSWPGNIRELKSLIHNLSIFFDDENTISAENRQMLTEEVLSRFFNGKTEKTDKNNKNTEPSELAEDHLAILAAINDLNNSNRTAGRYSLSKMQSLVAMNLTESKIKHRIKKLAALDLITIGNTKQGVSLTPEGVRLLSRHTSA